MTPEQGWRLTQGRYRRKLAADWRRHTPEEGKALFAPSRSGSHRLRHDGTKVEGSRSRVRPGGLALAKVPFVSGG